MPDTILDPTTALIVVDLQAGLAGQSTAYPLGDVVTNTAALADAFRARGLPVVLVNVAGTAPDRTERGDDACDLPDGFTDLLPAPGERSSDKTVPKHTWGALHNTDLADADASATSVSSRGRSPPHSPQFRDGHAPPAVSSREAARPPLR